MCACYVLTIKRGGGRFRLEFCVLREKVASITPLCCRMESKYMQSCNSTAGWGWVGETKQKDKAHQQ